MPAAPATTTAAATAATTTATPAAAATAPPAAPQPPSGAAPALSAPTTAAAPAAPAAPIPAITLDAPPLESADGISLDAFTAVEGTDIAIDIHVPAAAADTAAGADHDADTDATADTSDDRAAPADEAFDPSSIMAARAREHFEREVGSAGSPGSEGSSPAPSSDPSAPAPLPGATHEVGGARHHGSGAAESTFTSGSLAPSEALASAHDDVRGRLHGTYAQVSLGDGDQRIDLAIHARGDHIHIHATAADPELATALRDGSGDLASALARHGLALGDMSASPDRGQRDARGETPALETSHNAPTSSKPASPNVAPTRPGVRVVA